MSNHSEHHDRHHHVPSPTRASHEGHEGHADHGGHAGHAGHAAHAGHGSSSSGWSEAVSATLHCLTGCAIGEVLGMVIGTALGLSNVATIVLAVVLAFFFGYSLTITPVLRAGVPFATALGVTFAADTVSISVMEVIDNAIMVIVPGAMDAGLDSWLFWGALAFALALAFVLTVPVNRWLIGRGKGHAVMHEYHH